MTRRWAALATIDPDGDPAGSMVAYAPDGDAAHVLVFLSGLAAHTRHLLASGRCALVVGDPDPGEGDPQTLQRVSLDCLAGVIPRDHPRFVKAFDVYAGRFSDARARLALPDFTLFRLTVSSARFVGGFARAATVSGGDLARPGGDSSGTGGATHAPL